MDAPAAPGQDAAAVDVETTSLDPETGRVVAIGVCRVVDGAPGEPWSTLVDPGEWPETEDAESAARVHGIGPEDVKGAPSFAEAWAMARAEAGGLPLVAHNAAFDRGFLEAERARSGLAPDPLLDPGRWTDTLALSRAEFADRSRHGLDSLCRRLGIAARAKGARHEAGADAALLAACWAAWGGDDAQKALPGLLGEQASGPEEGPRESLAGLPEPIPMDVPPETALERDSWARAEGFL